MFHGRENVAVQNGPSLTFDCLLNCLDGVQRADGLMVMMTTNHLERVDPAIAQPGSIGSRPGRIDRIVSMGTLGAEGRSQLANRILGDWPEVIEDICKAGTDDTPAQFQERCGRLALRLHYGDAPEITDVSEARKSFSCSCEEPCDCSVTLPPTSAPNVVDLQDHNLTA